LFDTLLSHSLTKDTKEPNMAEEFNPILAPLLPITAYAHWMNILCNIQLYVLLAVVFI
jgi:hypothetical protein